MRRWMGIACVLFGAMLLTAALTAPPETRSWDLEWDDVVDGALPDYPKRAKVELSVIQNAINGRFVGPVAGSVREAIFTGEVVPSETSPLIILRQIEEGYTCLYQLQRRPGGSFQGVWHDSRARRGDVILRRRLDERDL